MNLYVVRHGEVDINKKNQINGRNNSILTNKGIEQAKETGEKLKNIKLDLIICSPLKRTKETLNYLNIKNVPIIYDELVIERNSGNKMYENINSVDKKIWYDPSKEIVYENSEGFKNILYRIEILIQKLKIEYRDKNILIVTHGDICIGINSYLKNISDINEIIKGYQDNCEVKKYKK